MPSSNARTHRKRLARAYAARFGTAYQQAHQRVVAAHQAGAITGHLSATTSADLDSLLNAVHAHALSTAVTGIPFTESAPSTQGQRALFHTLATDPALWSCLRSWDETNEPDPSLMNQVAEWAMRLLVASEDDRPGYDRLEDAAHNWDDHDEHDIDACHELVEAIRSITDADNMRVIEDGQGGHLRAADMKRGHTCAWCGNGYATSALLTFHHTECPQAPTPDAPEISEEPFVDWKSLLSDPRSPAFTAFAATCAPGDPVNLTTVAANLAQAPQIVLTEYPAFMARPAEGRITEPVGGSLDHHGHLVLRDLTSGRIRTYKFGAVNSTYAFPDLHRVHPDALGVTIHDLDGNPTAALRAAFPGDPLVTVASQYPGVTTVNGPTPQPCPECGDRNSRFSAAPYQGSCSLCRIPHTPDDEIDVAACVQRGLITGFSTDTWPAPQTHTLVGHWEGNTIVVEYTLPGEQQDDRPETGYWSEGLWASHGTGLSMTEIALHALVDYDQCHDIRAAFSEDDYTPSTEFAGTVCEICGEETDEKDRHGTLMCLDCQEDEDTTCRAEGCDEDSTGGEGYDGFCGNCADILYGHEQGAHQPGGSDDGDGGPRKDCPACTQGLSPSRAWDC